MEELDGVKFWEEKIKQIEQRQRVLEGLPHSDFLIKLNLDNLNICKLALEEEKQKIKQ